MFTVDDVKEEFKSRIKHPFLGAFLIATLIHNWKIVLYATTGEASASERIEQIEAYTTGREFVSFFERPLLVGICFAIGYPLLAGLISLWRHFMAVLENNAKSLITEKSDKSSDLILNQSIYIVRKTMASLTQVETLVSQLHNYFLNNDKRLTPDFLSSVGAKIDETKLLLEPVYKLDRDAIKLHYVRLKLEYKD